MKLEELKQLNEAPKHQVMRLGFELAQLISKS